MEGDMGELFTTLVEVECRNPDRTDCEKCRFLSGQVPIERVETIVSERFDHSGRLRDSRVVCRFRVCSEVGRFGDIEE